MGGTTNSVPNADGQCDSGGDTMNGTGGGRTNDPDDPASKGNGQRGGGGEPYLAVTVKVQMVKIHRL